MTLHKILAAACGILLGASAALAQQEMMVYPAKGQSPEQMQKDKYECYEWARGQSGFDPMAPPPSAPSQAPESNTGEAVAGGAVKGALLGTLIGGIAGGNWGHGAAYGAAAGGLFGGVSSSSQNKSAEQAQQQREQQQAAAYQQGRNNYNRAYAACMQGRGYTVN